MKKLLFVLCMVVCMCGCTSNTRARHYGGTMTINLPAGEELMEVTWKESSLFYLTRPMAPDYVPTVKTFREDSRFGMIQGTVIFVETR